MSEAKTKAIENIEKKMENTGPDELRYNVLRTAKNFKTSWIDLGQILYTVWKDKLYKSWGFNTFEAYTAKEIGVRKETAIKLLRSYCFLEREGPRYIKKEYAEKADAATVPTCDSINTLRLASKKKGIDRMDYERLKANVLEKGKDSKEIKKDLTALIRSREELDPDEARPKRRHSLIKRLITTLKSISQEVKIAKLLPAQSIKEIDRVIQGLERELS